MNDRTVHCNYFQVQSLDTVRQLVSQSANSNLDWTEIRQQDAGQFLDEFLSALHDELSSSEEQRILNAMFQVTVAQEYLCSGHATNNCQPQNMGHIPFHCLPIPVANSNSIETSLTNFFEEQNVEKRCSQCPIAVGEMTTKMETLPEILILQLQRFKVMDNAVTKTSRFINVPQRLVPHHDAPAYRLTGAIVHSGIPSQGHYISLVRCLETGRIFRVNDHQLPVEYEDSTKELHQAYIAIYSKETEAPEPFPEAECPVRKKPRISPASPQTGNFDGQKNNCKKDSFESMLKKLTQDMLANILDQLGLKKQNGFKRRQDDLRRYFEKNETEHERILQTMREPFGCSSKSNEVLQSSNHLSQASDMSGDSELPTPPYNQIYAHRPTASDQIDLIDHMVKEIDGAALTRILKKFGVTPQSTLVRRRDQLKKLLNNQYSAKHQEILESLKNEYKGIVYNSTEDIFYNTNNEDEVCLNHGLGNAESAGPDGDSVACTDPNRLDQACQDESDTELPTPPYVPLQQHGASRPNNTNVSNHVQTDGNKWNMQAWDRDFLKKYIDQHHIKTSSHNTRDFRKLVLRHVFDSLIENFNTSKLDELLRNLEIKKEDKIKRRKGQLRSHFLKTINCQNYILNFLEENQTEQNGGNGQETTSVYQNDFYPENMEDIEHKRVAIKAARVLRIEGLKTGAFNLINGEEPNPILEAGREMHQALRDIKPDSCIVCKNQWFDMNIGPKNGKCKRCAGERLKNGMPHTFSAENDMYPGLPPTSLSILNSVEVSAISLICPQMTVYKLKGGASGLKGHSLAFYQNVQGFVDKLPRRPEDLPIIVLKAPNQNVELKANRFKILNALEFLKQNNPEYKDISIDEDALGCYPPDSHTPVQNIPFDDTESMQALPQETTENLDDYTGVADDRDLVETAAPFELPTRPAAEQIRQAILGENTTPAHLNWPERTGAASEWEYGYFSKSFPHLFPYGQGDFTKPRIGKNPGFLDYIQHLTRLPGTHFAEDPRFLLHVISMYRRHKALTLGNVFASNVFKDMTMAELKDKVAKGDDAVMKSLVLFSGQIPGTKGYYSQEAKKSVAMERWIRLRSNGEEMLNVFLTFSLPDQHLDDLHRLLPGHERYLGKTVVKNLSDIPSDADESQYIDQKTDFNLRRKAVHDNGHIVDWYGTKRINILIEKVLKDTLGMTDYILRSEYQSRKSVHWHMAARMLGIGLEDIRTACKKYDFDVRASTEEEQAMSEEELGEYRRELMKMGINMDEPSTEDERQEVAESRQRVIDFTTKVLGLSTCHPQSDPKLWPGPEGQNVSAPSTNSLRENFLEITDFEADYERMVNRVMLHACRITYCLVQTAFGKNRCRFGYPLTLNGFIAKLMESDGHPIWNEMVRTIGFEEGAEFLYGTLEILRNHPRMVSHIPELLPIWRGNIDQKLINSPETLLKYILKYMMKPEEGSLPFNSIIKTMTENADETTETRKIYQKILLKSVAEHDISKNEAWRISSGKPFVQYSRKFRNLNLTGSRRVILEMSDDHPERQVLSQNFCDVYWAKESDENYLRFSQDYEEGREQFRIPPSDISLYQFTESFTMKWKQSSKLYVPKPTPIFHYVPLPSNEEYRKAYCETTLLLHKPGTTPETLNGEHPDAEAALFDFVNNDDRCPKIVREEYLKSLKMTPLEAEQHFDNVEDLVPSQGSQTVQMLQEDWMIGLGEPIRETDINDPEPDLEEDDDENVDAHWDKDADWTLDKQLFGLDNQQIDDGTSFIKHHKLSANLDSVEDESIAVDTLNADQKRIYDSVMDAVMLSGDQKLIDVSGGAGTGKSYLIKALLQNSENRIKIAAPTGCAAAQFSGGQTIHRLLKIKPKAGSKELEKLTPAEQSALQLAFKDTSALIIDEKGMIGLGRLAQINARLKETKPEYADQPFGGLTILLAGDLRQLPPIGDLPMFSTCGGDQNQCFGRVLYKMFDENSYSLRSQMRQQGEENANFRDQLERLAKGEFKQEDWINWSQQNFDTMDTEAKEMFFQTATMLCAKKKDSVGFNHRHLQLTNNPIAKLTAKNSPGASAFEADHAQGLKNKMYIAKGAKIVLTSNLWPEAKLVNGSQGTVKAIIYKDERQDLPNLILCHFPGYIGPSFIPGEERLVPIAPIEATWFSKNSQYSRVQYPLILSWAMTIHKAQGNHGCLILNLTNLFRNDPR